MKIVMIETGGWGGLAHYAWNLCRALATEGADVHLLTAVRYELAELDGGFRVDACLSAASFPRVAARVLGRIAALAPDVVHVQSLLSTRFDAALWPLARRRARLVATAHNVRPHEHGRWEEWTLWRTLRTADTVVAHTREAADLALRRLGSGHRVVKRIRNGGLGGPRSTAAATVPSSRPARCGWSRDDQRRPIRRTSIRRSPRSGSGRSSGAQAACIGCIPPGWRRPRSPCSFR